MNATAIDDSTLATSLPATGSKFRLSVEGYDALDMIKMNLMFLITQLPRTDVENPDMSLWELKGHAHLSLAYITTWLAENPELSVGMDAMAPLEAKTGAMPAEAPAAGMAAGDLVVAPAPAAAAVPPTGAGAGKGGGATATANATATASAGSSLAAAGQ
jgi:hypothetical protein